MGLQDTYNEIVEEIQSKDDLQELLPSDDNFDKFLEDVTTNSKVDPWRSMAKVIASVIEDFKVLFEAFKIEVANNVRAARTGQTQWWLSIPQTFQFGDSLVLVNGEYKYAVIDESKRIITNYSLEERQGVNVLKVVKGVYPDYQELSAQEYSAFDSVIRIKRPPGIRYSLISAAAEQVVISGDIFYNGQLAESEIQALVESAIDFYIKNLPVENGNSKDKRFNGSFVKNELIERVRELDGVNDFKPSLITVTSNGNEVNIDRTHSPISGWMRIKGESPLSETLNYYASNV